MRLPATASLLAAAALAVTASRSASARAQPATVVLDNVTIVDVAAGRLEPRRTITIAGKRILRIESASATTRARATLDGSGMFVIPGLWDMHVHTFFTNDTARFHGTSEIMLPLFVVNGVTGVRDLGSNLEATLATRDSIAAHTLIGPRMMVSGPMLDGPSSRYAAAIKVADGDEARAAVRMLAGRGVDLIKVQTVIPREGFFALADEATKLGIPFEGHVPNGVTGLEAVGVKMRSIEHLFSVTDTNTALITALGKGRVWQCPTIVNSVGTPADFASDPGLIYWGRTPVENWRRTAMTQANASDSAARAQSARIARRLALIRKLHDAGVPFLAGTDAPAGHDLVPGSSLHRELELFVRAGMTPLQALRTATLNPAIFFGREREWGTIAEGKVADLVLLSRNPLADIENTRRIVAVVQDGRYYAPRELDRMRLRIMEQVAK